MAKIFSLMSRLYGEIKKNGVSNTYYKVIEKQAKNEAQKDYEEKRIAALPTEEELEAQRKRNFMKDVTFSIVVPTFQTPELFLRQMIESVLGQTFCRVELILADGSHDDGVEKIAAEYAEKDPRIKYQRLSENKGISENTNEGLKLATGDYIGLLDHDDILELHALYEMRMAIAKQPEADVLYSDEDKVSFDLKHYFEPHFKPDFNPDLLRSNNYICHFLVFKKDLLDQVGDFRPEYDGAQDFDLVLRLTEKAKSVVHIPKVLYKLSDKIHKIWYHLQSLLLRIFPNGIPRLFFLLRKHKVCSLDWSQWTLHGFSSDKVPLEYVQQILPFLSDEAPDRSPERHHIPGENLQPDQVNPS